MNFEQHKMNLRFKWVWKIILKGRFKKLMYALLTYVNSTCKFCTNHIMKNISFIIITRYSSSLVINWFKRTNIELLITLWSSFKCNFLHLKWTWKQDTFFSLENNYNFLTWEKKNSLRNGTKDKRKYVKEITVTKSSCVVLF